MSVAARCQRGLLPVNTSFSLRVQLEVRHDDVSLRMRRRYVCVVCHLARRLLLSNCQLVGVHLKRRILLHKRLEVLARVAVVQDNSVGLGIRLPLRDTSSHYSRRSTFDWKRQRWKRVLVPSVALLVGLDCVELNVSQVVVQRVRVVDYGLLQRVRLGQLVFVVRGSRSLLNLSFRYEFLRVLRLSLHFVVLKSVVVLHHG